MREITSYIIDKIGYGKLCIELEEKAMSGVGDSESWSSLLASVLEALHKMEDEIVGCKHQKTLIL